MVNIKRIVSLCLAVILLSGAFPATVSAEQTDVSNYSWYINDGYTKMVYANDFSGADLTGFSKCENGQNIGFSVSDGELKVSGGHMAYTGSLADGTAAADLTDYVVSVNFKGGDNNLSITARAAETGAYDPYYFYSFGFSNTNTVRFLKRYDNAWQPNASADGTYNGVVLDVSPTAIDKNSWNNLSLKAEGNTLTLYLNGEAVGTAVDDYSVIKLDKGTFGIRCSNTAVTFDDLQVFVKAADSANAAYVENLIKALPDAEALVSADISAVESARAAYNALTSEEKAMISADAISRLTAAEAKIAELDSMIVGYNRTLFFDDFENGTITDGIPDGYIATGEKDSSFEWITGNGSTALRYKNSGSGNATAFAIAGGESWDNYVVSADVRPVLGGDGTKDTDADSGLYVRMNTADGKKNGYVFRIKNDGTVNILKGVDASWVNKGSLSGTVVNMDKFAVYNLKVYAEGNVFRVYVDNVYMGKYTDTDSPYLTGSAGVRAYGGDSVYDNLLVMGFGEEAYADYTEVSNAVASVPSDLTVYTEETVQAVEAALAAVETGYPAWRQKDVDAMAEAVNGAVLALYPKSLVFCVNISDGAVTASAAAGRSDITWNANVQLGDAADLSVINDRITFTGYGVCYGTSKNAVESAVSAMADSEAARIKYFAQGEDIDVYTIFGFRLRNVIRGDRAAKFFITYELGGQKYILTSDTALVSVEA